MLEAQPELEGGCKAIGYVVYSWTQFEISLDCCLAIVHGSVEGKHQNKDIPFRLKDRISYLRSCHMHAERMEPYSEKGLELLGQVAEVADVRDWLVHGFVSAYDQGKQLFLLVKLRPDKNKSIHMEERRWLSVDELLKCASDCQRLTSELAEHNKSLMLEFLPSDTYESFLEGLH